MVINDDFMVIQWGFTVIYGDLNLIYLWIC